MKILIQVTLAPDATVEDVRKLRDVVRAVPSVRGAVVTQERRSTAGLVFVAPDVEGMKKFIASHGGSK